MSEVLKYSRVEIPATIADLAFAIDVPAHWVRPEITDAEVDLKDPAQFAPLAMWVMPTSPVILAVAARPAYEYGTMYNWVLHLMESQQFWPLVIETTKVNGVEMTVGTATQAVSDLGPRHLRFAFFEDGGRLVNVFLTVPMEIERSFEELWNTVLHSFALSNPRGPTPESESGMLKDPNKKFRERLDKCLAEAALQAMPLVKAGRFDEADELIRAVDRDLMGGAAMSRMYRAHLEELVNTGELERDKPRVEAAFHKALATAIWAYPEPHTADESESYEAGRARDRANLVAILGYEPVQP